MLGFHAVYAQRRFHQPRGWDLLMTQTLEQGMERALYRLAREQQRSSIRLARELRRIAAGAKLSLSKFELKVFAQLTMAGDDQAADTARRIVEAARVNIEKYLQKRTAGLVDRWSRHATLQRAAKSKFRTWKRALEQT